MSAWLCCSLEQPVVQYRLLRCKKKKEWLWCPSRFSGITEIVGVRRGSWQSKFRHSLSPLLFAVNCSSLKRAITTAFSLRFVLNWWQQVAGAINTHSLRVMHWTCKATNDTSPPSNLVTSYKRCFPQTRSSPFHPPLHTFLYPSTAVLWFIHYQGKKEKGVVYWSRNGG